jgi:hypothetical protein
MTEQAEVHETPETRWVTAQDIQDAAFGLYFSDQELSQLPKLIAKAERTVISRIPRVLERIENGQLHVDTVRGVVERMVLRVVRNPEGLQSDSTGGVSSSWWRHSGSGVMELLKEDLQELMPRSRQFGSMRMSVPSWRLP